MSNNVAPGVYVNVQASAPSAAVNPSTGTWFVTGETAQGPVGQAVPITSMTDYSNFLGGRVAYGYLYDSLTEFFHDGGVLAYVSRVAGPTPTVRAAHVNITDRTTPTANVTLVATAAGPGTWGNSLKVVVAAGSVSTTYTLTVKNGTTVLAVSPNLFSPADALTWAASYNVWELQVVFTNTGDVATPPTNLPKIDTYDLGSGATAATGIVESTWTNALVAFGATLGPGQVSAPGHTTTTGYGALTAHAYANNRVALLDVADSASTSTLLNQAANVQALSVTTGYASMWAPWVVIPGIFTTNPGSSSPVPTRTIPPSAVAAALMAKSDQSATNTCNTPAAGVNGVSSYALEVTHTYTETALGNLNAGGICVIKPVNTAVTVYGYVSLSKNPQWGFLNNVRFRMQLINDFDILGEDFIFQLIDGKGHLFARFNGALAGKCQQYYTENALYGATATQAYSVNTGPQVNTPTSIQAGQMRARIGVVMSPFATKVYITITKYPVSTGLPAA